MRHKLVTARAVLSSNLAETRAKTLSVLTKDVGVDSVGCLRADAAAGGAVMMRRISPFLRRLTCVVDSESAGEIFRGRVLQKRSFSENVDAGGCG